MNINEKLEYPVKILIVDDSWVLRRVLRGTLSQKDGVEIVGEATNGIEALGMVLNLEPDVILLDMEMPVMDGMTTLQHLMIHTPTPTILLSSLSKNGTARCFDALKYGAVDFVSKNTFFKGMDGAAHSKLVLSKVFAAAAMSVHSIDPMQQKNGSGALRKIREKVIFCEDCGNRQVVTKWPPKENSLKCGRCGDEISLLTNKRYRRMNFVTVIGAGESGYANILKIIPELNPEMGGAICITILDRPENVESFVQYLDAISDFEVILGEDGATLEGGCCYIFSGNDNVTLSPYSGNFCFQVQQSREADGFFPINQLMASVASLLKTRASGVLLSGTDSDGNDGMDAIMQWNGSCFVLSPTHCLHRKMASGPLLRHSLHDDLDEIRLAARIQKCHFANKENVITA